MRFRLMLVVAAVALTATPASAQTVQQRFDAATTKLDAKDYAGALADFGRLESDLAARGNGSKQSLALVRARKGEVLSRLGRSHEAIEAYRAAVTGGGLDAPALATERDGALVSLARLEEAQLDYAAAAQTHLRVAEVTQNPWLRALSYVGAARSTMFVDGAAALAHADRAVALMQSIPDMSKADQAIVVGTKGRVLLNNGDAREASKLLERAVALRGGLTTKVDQWDIALRSDAAIAALRTGDEEAARRYLAFSGAGRLETQLPTPRDIELPACDALDGFSPDDSVVVQFALADDGRVVGALPVYASKPGGAAVEFARAVSGWTWDPAVSQKIDPFFRVATRLELRCSKARSRPGADAELGSALDEWLAANGAPPPQEDGRSDAARLPEQKARLETARQSGGKPALVGALWGLAGNAAVPREQSQEMVREALSVLPPDAPAEVRTFLAMHEVTLSASGRRTHRSYSAEIADGFRKLLAEPYVSADPRSRAVIGLALASSAGTARWKDVERAAVIAVTEDSALGPRDQLKIAALVMLANIEANAGNLAAAQAAYDRTGLTAQQCALIDGGPVLLKTGASSSDFPREAMRWGFEGWSRVEYDIGADGRTQNVRVVMAYPPAVFANASAGILQDARFRASYRPGDDLGCGGATQNIRFLIPG